jgi:hypothetical protein
MLSVDIFPRAVQLPIVTGRATLHGGLSTASLLSYFQKKAVSGKHDSYISFQLILLKVHFW